MPLVLSWVGAVLQPKDWSTKMNKKERRLALATALQSASPATTIIEDLTVSAGYKIELPKMRAREPVGLRVQA